ncbi:MAG: sulfite exporter TauE/SafE family protein [Anaerolineae bacterium]
MDSTSLIMVVGLFVLAIVSGMLGLGVAFAAVPFLSLFLPDLVHQVQPLTLILNGLTALFATLGFARSGYVAWRKALILAAITTISAPVGAWIAQYISQQVILYVYLGAVLYLAYRLFRPAQSRTDSGEERGENFRAAVILAIPISILAGFLGIGPGFLLMPTLILLGFEAKEAAGINAFAVTPPSFSALLPHLSTMVLDAQLTVALIVVGAVGAFAGARITSLYVPSNRLRQIFGVLIVVMTLYKIYTMISV